MTTASDSPTHAPDLSTGADGTLAAMQGLAAQFGVTLPGRVAPAQPGGQPAQGALEGDEIGDEGGGLPPDPGLSPSAASAQPAPVPGAPAKDEPPKNMAEYYAKLAAKDKRFQDARNENAQLRQQLEQRNAFDSEMRANPLAAIAKHYGLTTTDLNRRALDLGDLPGVPPSQQQAPAAGTVDLSKLPPDLRGVMGPVLQQLEQLKTANATLQTRLQQEDQTRSQTAAQQARSAEVATVADFIGKQTNEFPVLNDLGRADLVYDQVVAHIGQHGRFESEEDAAVVVGHIAKQVEAQLRSELRGYATKPGVRNWLLKELQNEATPARQETRAPQGNRIGAAPAVPNSLATQRASKAQPTPWAQLSYEEQMRRTAEEAVGRS